MQKIRFENGLAVAKSKIEYVMCRIEEIRLQLQGEGKQYPFHKKPSRRIETVMLHHVLEQTQAKKKGRLLK